MSLATGPKTSELTPEVLQLLHRLRCRTPCVYITHPGQHDGVNHQRPNGVKTCVVELTGKAGYNDPFHLEPEMIFAIMGALDLAGYRSSELYLDAAKSLHIASGHHWSQQL